MIEFIMKVTAQNYCVTVRQCRYTTADASSINRKYNHVVDVLTVACWGGREEGGQRFAVPVGVRGVAGMRGMSMVSFP